MRSPIAALIWQQWRETRLILALTLLALFVESLLFNALRLNKTFYAIDPGVLELQDAVPVCIAGIVIAFSHARKDDLRPSLPARVLTVPVSTSRLAFTYLSYRMVAVGLVAGLAAMSAFSHGSATVPDFGDVGLAILLSMACYAYLQAILWSAGALNVAAAGLVIVLTLPVVAWLVVHFLQITEAITKHSFGFRATIVDTGLIAFGLISLVSGFPLAASGLGVALERQGAWATIRSRLAGLVRARRKTAKSFKSPEEALVWFEWRRFGVVVPILTVMWFALLSFASEYQMRVSSSPRWDITQYVGFSYLSTLISVFIIGCLLPTQEFSDRLTGFSLFTMTRPVSTWTLAKARLRAAGRTLRYTAELFLAGLLLWSLLAQPFNPFRDIAERSEARMIVMLVLFALAGLGVAILFWVVMLYLPVLIALLLSAMLVFWVGTSWFHNDDLGTLAALSVYAGILALVIWWQVRYIVRHGLDREGGALIRFPSSVSSVLAPPMVMLCFTAFVYVTVEKDQSPEALVGDCLLWLGLCLTPYAVVTSWPVFLHRMRHR
ncbi:MAG: hypothetical protein HY706_17175 [Candidatus Hydrogenedentes bacterium]|nr:hypothetical protein [Candidatus Hydrogenedentota bacterium]